MSIRGKTVQRVLNGIGVIFFVYFIALCGALGIGYMFNYFWLFSGLACIALARLGHLLAKLPAAAKVVGTVALIVGLLIFCVVEGFIISGAVSQGEPGAEYLVVLGAKVNGTTPSKRLQERIDAAAVYARENPETMVIASGGQGADEGISEAQAIFTSLVAQGIDSRRILMEDQSTSTQQNLVNSVKLITSDKAEPSIDAKVVVVTSDFHVFRAVSVAKQAGYFHVSGLSAPASSSYFLLPNYYVREFFGVVNEFVLKKL